MYLMPFVVVEVSEDGTVDVASDDPSVRVAILYQEYVKNPEVDDQPVTFVPPLFEDGYTIKQRVRNYNDDLADAKDSLHPGWENDDKWGWTDDEEDIRDEF